MDESEDIPQAKIPERKFARPLNSGGWRHHEVYRMKLRRSTGDQEYAPRGSESLLSIQWFLLTQSEARGCVLVSSTSL